jgi:hypothetical protein
MTMKITDCCDLMPCDLVDVFLYQTIRHHIPDDNDLQCGIPLTRYLIDFQLC